MEDQQQEDAPPANNRAAKLPPFWTGNPRTWFASAEGAFQLRNISDERSRFFNCLHALPEATVCLIADLVEADPLPGPTSSPPTTASRPTMWWRRWPPFLFRIKKERRPQWLRSAQESVAGSAAAAADSGAAAGRPRRSRDAVAVPAAADSRRPTR